MALQQTIKFPSGVTGNYIRIEGDWLINIRDKECEVPIRIYKNQTSAKDLGLRPITDKVINLNGDKFPFTSVPKGDIRDYIYPLIKAEAYSGAKDV